jgi:methyl-accepting chemotaxis protein
VSLPFQTGDRASLAYRVRGWSSDLEAVEQRLKDLQTFSTSQRRRWWLIAGVMVLGLLGWAIEAVGAEPKSIVLVGGALLVANYLARIITDRGWYTWWLIYALALFDVVVVGVPVVWFGHGGLVAAFFLAVLPYTFDQGRGVGDFLVLVASIAYLGASALHQDLWGTGSALPPVTYVETFAFIVAALGLKRVPSTLIERVRRTRTVMGLAEKGDLAVRAPAVATDELGFLERSLNRMLEELAATISTVQRESDEVAAFAEQLAASSEELHATSESMGQMANAAAQDLARQRETAVTARGDTAGAAEQADTLRGRAEAMEVDAQRLGAAAERGRDRVSRASDTLLAVGEEVRVSAATVAGLGPLSQRIGGFAKTIARIARQTHLLALNAAIEAARAEEHGEGFAVVAEEVRSLAAEAGKSAREVAELVGDLQAGIQAATQAMESGQGKVRDIGLIAGEADAALKELHEGIARVGDLVAATADVSRRQATRMAALATSLADVAAISARSSQSADSAAAGATAQIASMNDLTTTSQQLAQLAERLRASIARFSVIGREVHTAEHRALPRRKPEQQAAD